MPRMEPRKTELRWLDLASSRHGARQRLATERFSPACVSDEQGHGVVPFRARSFHSQSDEKSRHFCRAFSHMPPGRVTHLKRLLIW